MQLRLVMRRPSGKRWPDRPSGTTFYFDEVVAQLGDGLLKGPSREIGGLCGCKNKGQRGCSAWPDFFNHFGSYRDTSLYCPVRMRASTLRNRFRPSSDFALSCRVLFLLNLSKARSGGNWINSFRSCTALLWPYGAGTISTCASSRARSCAYSGRREPSPRSVRCSPPTALPRPWRGFHRAKKPDLAVQ